VTDQEDCNCKNRRWTVLLVIMLGLFFGVVGGAFGAAIWGTFAKWSLAVVGAAFGGFIAWNVQPLSADELFFKSRNRNDQDPH
jgi:H+/Cl- antiporter ClcA